MTTKDWKINTSGREGVLFGSIKRLMGWWKKAGLGHSQWPQLEPTLKPGPCQRSLLDTTDSFIWMTLATPLGFLLENPDYTEKTFTQAPQWTQSPRVVSRQCLCVLYGNLSASSSADVIFQVGHDLIYPHSHRAEISLDFWHLIAWIFRAFVGFALT